MEPYEKVFVDSDFLEEDPHGQIPCSDCHGGDPSDSSWETAHKGVVKDPSFEKLAETCGNCHEKIAGAAPQSVHYTLQPYWRNLYARMDTSNRAVLGKVKAAFKNHCQNCHSSCGQCHVSRPDAVEGGFVDGHFFHKRPDMETNCTACHGSRVQKEFMGKNKGYPGDVHFIKGHMNCNRCHSADEMHTADGGAFNRYLVDKHQTCESCHPDAASQTSKVKMHSIHTGKVQCQVCHSVAYKNCYGCHVGKDAKGLPYYQVDSSTMDFKIARNPLKSKKRPYDFVLVRHVPTNPHLFDYYVKDAFVRFDSLTTFKYATPHNIQLRTPQTASCNACHGNRELFLTEDSVPPGERTANRRIIVRESDIPQKR